MLNWKVVLVVAGVAVVVPVVYLAVKSALAKRPENLGATAGRLAPCADSPNCVSSQAPDERHAMEPLGFEGSAEEALERLEEVIEGMLRTRVVTRREDYLHAEFTSALFRFVDDVEFLVLPEEQVIHFRSASRVGYSDLGANRKRMEEIRRRFEAR